MDDKLPFLPGNSFPDLTKTNFHKAQTLNYQNGYAVPKSQATMLEPNNALSLPMNENESKSKGNSSKFIPKFVLLDKKVLKFEAYKSEEIQNSRDENFRVRIFNIYYYLEDDTISVVEPRIENSGIDQGMFIRRQAITKMNTEKNWHWKDFSKGKEIQLFGHKFHLIDCDQWTKQFFESHGVGVDLPKECPSDPYISKRMEQMKVSQHTTPSTFDKLKRFIELDKKVLRFYGIVQTESEIYEYTIHYYLMDDTIEIIKKKHPEDSSEVFPLQLKRQKLSKNSNKSDNTCTSIKMETNPADIEDHFVPTDFILGSQVTILGKTYLICDGDEFTKSYFIENYGLKEWNPVNVSNLCNTDIKQSESIDEPKENESSLPIADGKSKMNINNLIKYGNKTLRYEADLNDPDDKEKRRFIITYWLVDETLSIYEPPVPNSGISGGTFLKRMQVIKPKGDSSDPHSKQYYSLKDLHVGATLTIFSHKFEITGADEYVYNYMREHPKEF